MICINSVNCLNHGALYPLGIGHNRVNADIHALDGDSGVLADLVLHLAHNGAAGGGDVDAVFHDDVEPDRHSVVLIIYDLDAFAHGFLAQEVDQTVSHGAERHALNAEAVGGGVAGNVGEYGVADTDLAFVGL